MSAVSTNKNNLSFKQEKRYFDCNISSLKTNDNKLNSVTGSGGSSDGSSSKYAPRYFSIDFEKANGDWEKIMATG